MHLDGFGGRDEPQKKTKKSGQKSGHSCGHSCDHKVGMDVVADACSILIQHLIDMGSDTVVLNIRSASGGTAKVTVEIIDHGEDS